MKNFGIVVMSIVLLALPTIAKTKTSKEKILATLSISEGRTIEAIIGKYKGPLLLRLVDKNGKKTDPVAFTSIEIETKKNADVVLTALQTFAPDVFLFEVSGSANNDLEGSAFVTGVRWVRKEKISGLGPEFSAVGTGDGGIYRTFEYADLAKKKTVQLLIGLSADDLRKNPKAKILRKDRDADGEISIAVEEEYVWDGQEFATKTLLNLD